MLDTYSNVRLTLFVELRQVTGYHWISLSENTKMNRIMGGNKRIVLNTLKYEINV